MRTIANLLVRPWLVVCLCLAGAHAEPEVTQTVVGPRGTFRIQAERAKVPDPKFDVWMTTTWIVSAADPSQRARLGEPYDDGSDRSFFISPDEHWIFSVVHANSQMQGGMLYRQKTGLQFELVMADDVEGIADGPRWDYAADDKAGRASERYDRSDDENFGGTWEHFIAWSSDSARLLVQKQERLHNAKTHEHVRKIDYFYYNLRRGVLERTPYLRSLNRKLRTEEAEENYVAPSVAEPLDPLPPAPQIRARYETAEHKLKESYGRLVVKETPERKKEMEAYQRRWLKALETDADAFSKTGTKAERPQRRLQYLADATEARLADVEYRLEEIKRAESADSK